MRKLGKDGAPNRPAIVLKKKKFSRIAIKGFLAHACGVRELDEAQPITTLTPNVQGGRNPYYTVVAWAENRFNKRIENQFVESKTIGELIDVLCK